MNTVPDNVVAFPRPAETVYGAASEAAAEHLRKMFADIPVILVNGSTDTIMALSAGLPTLIPDKQTESVEAMRKLAVTLSRLGTTCRVVNPKAMPEGWTVCDVPTREAFGELPVLTLKAEKPKPAKATAPDPVMPKAMADQIEMNPAAPVPLIPGTDMANARRFAERHGDAIRFTVEKGWMVWSGQRWQHDEKGVAVAQLAMESAESMLDELKNVPARDRDEAFKVAKLSAQKRAIEASVWMARSHCPEHITTFDADHMILNCRNGIVNLTTGELMPHTRDRYCSLMAGCEYHADAVAPRWEQFIREITLGNENLIGYVQRMCGYLLTGNTREQCLFFWYGDGANGKSTACEVLQTVMGDYAVTAEPDMLMAKRFAGIPNDIARLRGARACFLNETRQGASFDEQKLKNLTGGDSLQARELYESLFTFKPTHKLLLRGNHKPTVHGTDEGIWRRLRLIPFDLRLADNQKDLNLLPALEAEQPGILAWMVRGCLAWQRDGLGTPDIVMEAVKEYREESDTLGRFIEEYCIVRTVAQIKTSELHKAYRDFCEHAGERYLSAKDFPGEVERRGFKRRKSNGVRLFDGIELKTALNDTGRWEKSDEDEPF